MIPYVRATCNYGEPQGFVATTLFVGTNWNLFWFWWRICGFTGTVILSVMYIYIHLLHVVGYEVLMCAH